MSDGQKFTCSCGFTWLRGQRGSHECGPYYLNRIAELERQVAELVKDAERLDYVVQQSAWVQWHEFDSTFKRCQLMTQDEDESFVVLSGHEDRYFATPRDAIDAALAQAKTEGA